MSGSGFLLLALLLLVTVEASKVEQEKKGMQTDQLKKFSALPRVGRQNMQSPLFSERLRTRALGFRQLSSQKQ
nr:TPA_inf: hormone Conorfamide [Conus judaeus]